MTLHFSGRVTQPTEMIALEARISSLLRCEEGKCSHFRSEAFVRFRLKLLYRDEPIGVQSSTLFLGPLRVVAYRDNTVEVYGPEAIYDPLHVVCFGNDPQAKRRKI